MGRSLYQELEVLGLSIYLPICLSIYLYVFLLITFLPSPLLPCLYLAPSRLEETGHLYSVNILTENKDFVRACREAQIKEIATQRGYLRIIMVKLFPKCSPTGSRIISLKRTRIHCVPQKHSDNKAVLVRWQLEHYLDTVCVSVHADRSRHHRLMSPTTNASHDSEAWKLKTDTITLRVRLQHMNFGGHKLSVHSHVDRRWKLVEVNSPRATSRSPDKLGS